MNEIKNKRFVFTGILEGMTRKEAQKKVRAAGGTTSNNVSYEVNFLVIGNSPGATKVNSLRNSSAQALTEGKFLEMLKEASVDIIKQKKEATKTSAKQKSISANSWVDWRTGDKRTERRRWLTNSVCDREVYDGKQLLIKETIKEVKRYYSRKAVPTPYGGLRTVWFPDGKLKEKGEYGKRRRGWSESYIKVGQHQSWYSNGQLESEEMYDSQGRRNGKFAEYTLSGLVKRVRYFSNDVRIPEFVFTTPEKIQPEDILAESNAEVRRIMLERIGYEVFLSRCGDKISIVDENKDPLVGTLLSVEMPGVQGRSTKDNTIMLLKVKDGTLPKHYVLRVPPTMKTAKQANAWTWGLKEDEYVPSKET